MELLAPAGGPEAFWAALAAGADAIYCGLGSDFNARRLAGNFDIVSFKEACRAAHLAGVRVYVTENVIVRTSEMPAALALAHAAWVAGADGLIIQDWGLLHEIRVRWPEIECHISTQANIHDPRGVAWCRSLGATRVTLSRELPLTEIQAISEQERAAEAGVELEAFGHGALCFCYSGICLLSSMVGGRSANRGMCAQPCRLPYELVGETGETLSEAGRTRPMCPKDACTIADIDKMVVAGVDALKIEGRMKASEYVYSVVSGYREVLDSWEATGEVVVSDEVRVRLERAFNRGFTDEYQHGRSGDEMMSYERSNNRGQLVGEVVDSVPGEPEMHVRGGRNGGRRDRRRMHETADTRIRLTEPVGLGDLLEIRPVADPSQFLTGLVRADAAPGEEIVVRTKRQMPAGSHVRVIRSQVARSAAQAAISAYEAGGYPRKRLVDVRVVARRGEPFLVELTADDGTCASAEGPVVETARTRSITAAELAEHVGRMGASPFEPRHTDVEVDEGCGIGFSVVHRVRAEACEALERLILSRWEGRATRMVLGPDTVELPQPASSAASGTPVETAEVCARVRTPDAARVARAAGATRIYVDADDIAQHDGWPQDIVPILHEVCRTPDHARLDGYVVRDMPVAVANISELALAAERGAHPEICSCIPAHNPAALEALKVAGAAFVWLSSEMTLSEIAELAPYADIPLGMVVSGRVRVMTSEHCILQVANRCIHDCANCTLRQQHTDLRDEQGALLPVRTGLDGRSRLYLSAPLDATPQIGELLAAGVSRFLVDGTLLDDEELAHAVRRCDCAVDAARTGARTQPREAGATSGHLFRGIE